MGCVVVNFRSRFNTGISASNAGMFSKENTGYNYFFFKCSYSNAIKFASTVTYTDR